MKWSLATFTCLLANLTLTASGYQYPISQQLSGQHQLGELQHESSRKVVEENEAQQLRQLHQVVDTMAQMLSEQEQHEAAALSKSGGSLLPQSSQYQSPKDTPTQRLSENEIRQAIEELERVQRQEQVEPQQTSYSSLVEAESRVQPVVAALESELAIPHSSRRDPKHATLESLIEELGDEFIDEHILGATQEAERLVQAQDSTRVPENKSTPRDLNEPTKKQAKLTVDYSSTKPETHIKQYTDQHRVPNANLGAQQVNSTSNSSPLFVGSLDPQTSALSSSLTNDFYSFQSGQTDEASTTPVKNDQTSSSLINQPETVKQITRDATSLSNDLDFAAQTRNTISQRNNNQNLQNFGREQAGTVRFDFTQPVPTTPSVQQLPPALLHQISSQQPQPARSPRERSGTSLEEPQFSTSTLLPSPDTFWRPSENFGQGVPDTDINQQYFKASESQQGFPSLPPPRFQSLSPSPQFVPQSGSSRQSPHTHFTGHSFISIGNQQNIQPPQPVPQPREKPSPTPPPMISVLTGGDNVGLGNSVTWNPPSNIAPIQPIQNQFIATSTQVPRDSERFDLPAQPSQFATPANKLTNSFVPVTNINQFDNSIQSANNDRFSNSPNIHRDARPISSSSLDVSEAPESATELRTERPATTTTSTTQWAVSTNFPAPINEREVSDSRPRSSIRSPNDERGLIASSIPRTFPAPQPNRNQDISGYESPRPLKLISTTTSNPTTLNPVTTPATNITKKEDMVIYYYYYYDDNKNATVVAKNISAGHNPATLPTDVAIEADSGVEDTPYMDDPAPISNLDLVTSRPVVAFTSTTPPSFVSDSTLEEDSRSRFLANSVRISPVSESPQSIRTSTARLPIREDFRLSSSRPQTSDQVRSHSPSRTSTPSSHRASSTDQSSSFVPTPSTVPTSTSSRSRTHQEAPPNLRLTSTELPLPRIISSIRPETANIQRANTPANTSGKLQSDLINNVLNGIPNQPQSRILSSSSTASTPSFSSTSSTTTGSSRSANSLSNASRYGTSNNIMIDPYGIDPASPTSILGNSYTNLTSSHSHKNWHQHTPSTGNSQQFGRKPAADVGVSRVNTPPVREQEVNSARLNNQVNVPPQRVNDGFSQQSARATNINAPPAGVRTLNTPAIISSNVARKVFPESVDSGRNSDRFSADRIISTANRQTVPDEASAEQPANLDDQSNKRLIASSENPLSVPRDVSIRPAVQNNGRPSPVEGNTGNGFTRSPLTISSSTSASIDVVEDQSQGLVTERVISRLSPVSTSVVTNAPTVSTSVSRSFSIPQGQITTSVSPPSVSTSSVTTTVSQSTSNSESSSPPTPVSSTSNTTTTTTSTTSAPEVSSQPAEDSLTSATRKRFGNRNNRFQTRLNSLSTAAPRSASTTTPAPSSTTTTRRSVSTTTRRSSKQLYAGRRRLGSTQADSDTASSTSTSSPSSSPIAASSLTSPSSDPSASTASPARSRFGNSFTPRTKPVSTTPSLATPEQGESAPKLGLFGAQRANSKSRLPFLKPGKPNQTVSTSPPDNSSSSSQASVSESPGTSGSTLNADKPSAERVALSSEESDKMEEVTDGVLTRSIEGENLVRKEQSVISESPKPSVANTISSTTAAPVPLSSSTTQVPEESTGRNKPKVRPLFASRQRSTSLFGNRRTNEAST